MREPGRKLEETLHIQHQIRSDRVWVEQQLRSSHGQSPSVEQVEAVAAASERMARLQAYAPTPWKVVQRAIAALSRRRFRLQSVLENSGNEGTEHTVRTRNLNSMNDENGNAALLLRTDAELLAHQDPDMVERRLVPKADAWHAHEVARLRNIPVGKERNASKRSAQRSQ